MLVATAVVRLERRKWLAWQGLGPLAFRPAVAACDTHVAQPSRFCRKFVRIGVASAMETT
jgi:hypothetical protein